MSSNGGNPDFNSPNGQQTPRSAGKNALSQGGTSQDNTPQSGKSQRNQRRRRHSKQPQPNATTTSMSQPQPMSLAPPLAFIQSEDLAFDGSSDSATPNRQYARKHSTPTKPQSSNPSISTSPRPRKNHSPRPGRNNSAVTPIKSGTPAQAYAGPTFHASPAPSALPIPKFFSQSVPVADKGTSLKTLMKDESSSGSSDRSDNSPTMRNSLQVSERPEREASPLDVFFNADRKEKAKRLAEVPRLSNESPEQHFKSLKSVSPIPQHMRHHSRNSTGGSTSGVFPLEMDASENLSPHGDIRPSSQFSEGRRSESIPSLGIKSAANHEAAKAKTEALKKFLRSVQAQQSASDFTVHANLLPGTGSPASGPPNFYRSSSTSAIPALSPDQPKNAIKDQTNYCNPQQSPHEFMKATVQPRPLSSSLRRELKNDSLPDSNELPSTPTRTRSYNGSSTTSSQRHHSVTQPTRDNSQSQQKPGKKFQPEDALRVLAGQNNSNVHVMENELRRILKLDLVNGSGGATEIRS